MYDGNELMSPEPSAKAGFFVEELVLLAYLPGTTGSPAQGWGKTALLGTLIPGAGVIGDNCPLKCHTGER